MNVGKIGAGIQVVVCCDEDDDLVIMVFWKGCVGAGTSADASVGAVSNFSGKGCDASRYEGFFLEVTAGAGAAGGYDRGTNRDGSPSYVDEAGIGVGGGYTLYLCEYKLIFQTKVPKGCSNSNLNKGFVPEQDRPPLPSSISDQIDLLQIIVGGGHSSSSNIVYWPDLEEEEEECLTYEE